MLPDEFSIDEVRFGNAAEVCALQTQECFLGGHCWRHAGCAAESVDMQQSDMYGPIRPTLRCQRGLRLKCLQSSCTAIWGPSTYVSLLRRHVCNIRSLWQYFFLWTSVGNEETVHPAWRTLQRRLNANVCVVRIANEGIRCVCAVWVFCFLHVPSDGKGKGVRCRVLFTAWNVWNCVVVFQRECSPIRHRCGGDDTAATAHECCSSCIRDQGFQRVCQQWGSQ